MASNIVFLDHSEFFYRDKIKLPETEAAIVELVQGALKGGQKVRVLGSGHSRNALAQSRDVIVSLEQFKGAVHLDRNLQQVPTYVRNTVEPDILLFIVERVFAIQAMNNIIIV